MWNISSTAAGGGVAEMLRSLLRYARGEGVDVRWLVVDAPPEFFRITKRVHHALHRLRGRRLSARSRADRRLRARHARERDVLDTVVRPGDVIICHDPQTAGLVPHLLKIGARVIWRCHIGHERHDAEANRGWTFLRPYLQNVPIAIFSRRAYAPSWLEPSRTVVLFPTINPFAAKNQPMGEASRDPSSPRSASSRAPPPRRAPSCVTTGAPAASIARRR